MNEPKNINTGGEDKPDSGLFSALAVSGQSSTSPMKTETPEALTEAHADLREQIEGLEVASKACASCFQVRPLSEFYTHKTTADKLEPSCKACCRTAAKINRLRKQTDHEWAAKERARCREKTARYRAQGKVWKSPEAAKRWAKENRHKRTAHIRANSALRSGSIQKPDCCSICCVKTPTLEMHHNDYSKPLDVQWLCLACHGLTRRKDGGVK